MHTVKLQFKSDESLFVIICNIDSVTYRSDPDMGDDLVVHLTPTYQIAFNTENWFVVGVW